MQSSIEKQLLFVGLGNPGRRYRKTRHNLGFLVLERFAEKWDLQFREERALLSECAKGIVKGASVILAKPTTFMNLSGDAVQRVMRYYRLPLSSVVVVADDVSLPVGQLRLRLKGSAGGHNGLKSVETSLGTTLYKRLKLGVQCEDFNKMPLDAFVLSSWREEDKEAIDQMIEQASVALEMLITESPEMVMNRINKTENENESKSEKPL